MPSQAAAGITDNQGTPKAGLLTTNQKSFRDEATMHGIALCSPAAPLPSSLQLSTTAAAGGRLWAAVPAGAAGRPRWLSSAAPAPAAPCSTGNSHCSSLMRGARGHESMSACRNGCRQQPHPDQESSSFWLCDRMSQFHVPCNLFHAGTVCALSLLRSPAAVVLATCSAPSYCQRTRAAQSCCPQTSATLNR